jgi:hypothetical protein
MKKDQNLHPLKKTKSEYSSTVCSMNPQDLYDMLVALPSAPDVVSPHILAILEKERPRVNAPVRANNDTVKTPFDGFLIEACLLGSLDKTRRAELLEAFLRCGANVKSGKKSIRAFTNMMASFGFATIDATAQELIRLLDSHAAGVRFNPTVKLRYFTSLDNLDLQEAMSTPPAGDDLVRSSTF